MIISASRRTDIPAFFASWFMARLREGFAYVRNPMNYRQVSVVPLQKEAVDCLVFWSKNPNPLLPYLREIEERGYCFYFQFTLTPYDNSIERDLPPKEEIVDTFRKVAEALGAKRVIWRYDPIFVSQRIDVDYHLRQFERLARELKGYTERCVFSFLDFYRKIRKNTGALGIREISSLELAVLGEGLGRLGAAFGLEMCTCAEAFDLSFYGIKKGKCIDDGLITALTGKPLAAKKDRSQRLECGCVQSVDLGAYNTCGHQCLYCYANDRPQAIRKNRERYDLGSPLLCSALEAEDHLRLCGASPGGMGSRCRAEAPSDDGRLPPVG